MAGGASLAQAATETSATPGTSTTTATSTSTAPVPEGDPAHTVVTGAEADGVIAAVTAFDANATITTVEKDADGSYDARGTSTADNSRVSFEVSADLATVTSSDSGGGRGPNGNGGPHGHGSPEVDTPGG